MGWSKVQHKKVRKGSGFAQEDVKQIQAGCPVV